MVIVIPCKEILGGLATERCMIGFELVVFNISPLLINVLLIKIVFFRRNERRSDLSVPEVIPWEITKPSMILNFFSSVATQSVLRLPLDHLCKRVTYEM